MAALTKASSRACETVLAAIRRSKPAATGKVFKALHECEGKLYSAKRAVRYGRKRGKGKKKAKA